MSGVKLRSKKLQIRAMVDFMANSTGEFTGPPGSRKAEAQWLKLKNLLKNYGPDRSIQQWKQTWKDLKKNARLENASSVQPKIATGNIKNIPIVSFHPAHTARPARPQEDFAEPQEGFAQPQEDFAQPEDDFAQPQEDFAQPQQESNAILQNIVSLLAERNQLLRQQNILMAEANDIARKHCCPGNVQLKNLK